MLGCCKYLKKTQNFPTLDFCKYLKKTLSYSNVRWKFWIFWCSVVANISYYNIIIIFHRIFIKYLHQLSIEKLRAFIKYFQKPNIRQFKIFIKYLQPLSLGKHTIFVLIIFNFNCFKRALEKSFHQFSSNLFNYWASEKKEFLSNNCNNFFINVIFKFFKTKSLYFQKKSDYNVGLNWVIIRFHFVVVIWKLNFIKTIFGLKIFGIVFLSENDYC